MGTAIQHPMPDRVKPSFVFFTFGHCESVKNYNDGLTRFDIGWFIAVSIWQQWASKG